MITSTLLYLDDVRGSFRQFHQQEKARTFWVFVNGSANHTLH